MILQAKTSKMIADKPPAPQAPQHTVQTVRTIESAEIFRGQSEIVIRHDDFTYRLKITRQGKLILNK
jgi:hemin uptake protein HemP